MARGKKYQPEQVVNLLRQIEVAVANGKTTAQACKEAEIVEQTYFRWRKEYGGLQVDQAKRLKVASLADSISTDWMCLFLCLEMGVRITLSAELFSSPHNPQ